MKNGMTLSIALAAGMIASIGAEMHAHSHPMGGSDKIENMQVRFDRKWDLEGKGNQPIVLNLKIKDGKVLEVNDVPFKLYDEKNLYSTV